MSEKAINQLENNDRQEILSLWAAVKSDRASRDYALENTGPGESPWHPNTERAWHMREQALANKLLEAMPILAKLLQE